MLQIIGIDPGFSSIGIVAIQIRDDTPILMDAKLIETKPFKEAMRASEENVIRTKEIYREVLRFFHRNRGNPDGTRLIACEEQSWPRNASSAIKVAFTWGVICAHSVEWDCDVFQVSPKKLKKELTGDSSASKEMVEMFVDSVLSGQLGCMLDVEGLAKSKRNHVYDAAGAAICAWRNSA